MNPIIPQWRRDQIKYAVLVALDECRVGLLPVSMEDILAHYGWNKETMDYAAAHGVVLEGTDDGFTLSRLTSDGWQYIIIYNRFCSSKRIYWTLAHEVGHIILGHANRSAERREWGWEAEANYFAHELLTPLAVFYELSEPPLKPLRFVGLPTKRHSPPAIYKQRLPVRPRRWSDNP